MPSSRMLRSAAVLLALGTWSTAAAAQQSSPHVAQGFALERLYTSAPGAGWFVMDALDMRGGLGGVMALTTGYAANPLRIPTAGPSLPVVSDQAFVGFGIAATYDRFRLYLDLAAPLVT